MSYLDILGPQITLDEGKRSKMYLDSRGIPTIGIGHNLRDRVISERAIQVIFEDDVAIAEIDARALVKTFDELSDVRKAAVVNLAFNMGYAVLSQFKRTLALIDAGDFSSAADALLESRYAAQVGARALRVADALRRG